MQVASVFVWFLIVAVASYLYSTSPDETLKIKQIQKNLEELPPPYDFDDVTTCVYPLGRYSRNNNDMSSQKIYCVSKTYINSNSDLFYDIQKSKSSKHFNRETISTGICLKKCEQQLSGLPAEVLEKLSSKQLSNCTENECLEKDNFQQCVNLRLEPYNGSGETVIEYCSSNPKDDLSFDVIDITFLTAVLGMVLSTISSTLYDYYGGQLPILKSFSLKTNWIKFTQDHGKCDVVFLDFIKVFMQAMNVSGHLYFLLVSNPHRNSIELEMNRYSAFIKLGVGINFTNFVFFTITGFVSSMRDVENFEKGKVFNFYDLIRGIKDRYLRLAPMLVFVILLQSSVVEEISSGPVWLYSAGTEKAYCRENYWTNLLFINNFVNSERACLLPTWYLANDLQLHAVKYLFFIFISHFRSHKYRALGCILLTSTVILLCLSAVYEINGLYIPSMEACTTFTRADVQFNGFIKPFYTNFGCYFIGVLTAFLDFEIKKHNIDVLNSRLFVTSWHSMKLMIFFLLIGSYVFETYDVYTAFKILSGGLYRLAWAVVVSILILGYRNGVGGFWKDLMNANAWKRLSKVNYCVLLCHIFTFQLLMGSTMRLGLVEVTNAFFITMIVLLVGASYAIAVIFYMLVELPIANLVKLL